MENLIIQFLIKNLQLYEKYKKLAEKEEKITYRTTSKYKYFNMDAARKCFIFFNKNYHCKTIYGE